MTLSSLAYSNQPSGKVCGTYVPNICVDYRPSQLSDCYEVASIMSKKDAYEVLSSGGLSPLEALKFSFERSYECNTIVRNGEPMGMFGCGFGDHQLYGIPWMLTDGNFEGFKKRFLKEGRSWIEKLKNRHQILYNYVHDQNDDSIRWLQWLGFKFMRAIPNYGFGKSDTFYEFYLVSDQCVVLEEPTLV